MKIDPWGEALKSISRLVLDQGGTADQKNPAQL
jgi:hypothetical protein